LAYAPINLFDRLGGEAEERIAVREDRKNWHDTIQRN
jgi:hypothetical protein